MIDCINIYLFLIRLDLNMKEFTVYGYKQKELVPVIVKSILEHSAESSLLDIRFEMNPLDKVSNFIQPFESIEILIVLCLPRNVISALMSMQDHYKLFTMRKQ